MSNLQHEIPLIQQDPCFTGAGDIDYPDCAGRYIAEIDNVITTARGLADQAAHPGRVLRAASVQAQANSTFQRHCDQGTNPSCRGYLRAVDTDLARLRTALGGPAPAANTS